MALASDVPKFRDHLRHPGHEGEAWVNFIEGTLLVFLYATAGSYALWHRLKQKALLRLVFWLVIAVAAVELICTRAAVNFYLLAESSPDAQRQGSLYAMLAALALLTFDHFIACVFMPWTARESLRPAAELLAMYGLLLLWDVATLALPIITVATIPVLAICFIPGTLICLWRTSRFRTIFKLRFESSRYRELQGELASARRLHEASMPKPRTDGPIRLHYMYEPMRQIGGDLLFVHLLAETPHIASVVVLDVTGHGIAAAMTVNRLIGELERQFAYAPDVSPDKVLKDLNRYVALTLSRHTIYATALCMKINMQTGELIWANAGHPPAYLYRTDGSFEPLGATAPILGVDESEEFFDPLGTLTMHPSDVLVAYTDGLNEAINPKGDQLGLEGVRRLITQSCAGKCATDAWPKQMLEEVLNYRQSPVEDDTLVVAMFGAPPGPA
jgi:serine phosphatase RsbU (regulator of sigma subunit)